MKKFILFCAALFLFACSQTEETGILSADSDNLDFESPVYAKAVAAIKACFPKDVRVWNFKDGSNDFPKGVSVPLNDSLVQENFSIEVDFAAGSEGLDGGLASSGVVGEESGWVLRLEDGKLVLLVRDQGAKSWFKIFVGKALKEEWNEVRLDHVDSLIAVTVNGEMVFAVESSVDFSKMEGDLTVGFSLEQADTSYFHGQIGRFCYRQLDKHNHDKKKDEEKNPKNEKDSVAVDSVKVDTSAVDTASVDTFALNTDWIVDYEFSDVKNAGRDFSGNGYHAVVAEGDIAIDSGIAYFDGKSGLRLSEGKNIRLGEFVVEARVFPQDVSGYSNIFVTEPPGYGPDGWIFRFEAGDLVFLVRDAAWGADWQGVSVADVKTNQWYDIRVECTADSIRLFLNGDLKAEKAITGNYDNLEYQWGVGYDAVNQAIHNRYFLGYIDYVRVGKFQREESPVDTSVCSSMGLAADEHTLFFDEMDSVIYQGTLVEGICGNAISFESGELVKTAIDLEDTIPVGTIEFWFRPGEDFYDERTRTILGNDESRAHFFVQDGDLIFQKNHADLHYFVRGHVELSDGWNLIAGQWGDGFLSIYVNGALVGKVEHSEPYVPSLRNVENPNLIVAGRKSSCCMEALSQNKAMTSSGTIDQVRVSDIARYSAASMAWSNIHPSVSSIFVPAQ